MRTFGDRQGEIEPSPSRQSSATRAVTLFGCLFLTDRVAINWWHANDQGTTVATLKEKLEKEDKKQVVCWSNGNIFRSVTLLAVTWCEQQEDCDGFEPAKALTKENLASFMNMLEFGKVSDGTHNIQLGIDVESFFFYTDCKRHPLSSMGSSIPKSAALGSTCSFPRSRIPSLRCPRYPKTFPQWPR